VPANAGDRATGCSRRLDIDAEAAGVGQDPDRTGDRFFVRADQYRALL
jgi:hypothetical protein